MDIQTTDCGIHSSVRPDYAVAGAFYGSQELNWYPTEDEKDPLPKAPN